MKKHIVFVVIAMLCGFGCTRLKQGGNGKCEGNSLGDYLFDLPVSITPAQDTFHVGDTLWITQDFSENLLNLRNGKTYAVKDLDFMMQFSLQDLMTAYEISNWNITTLIGTASEDDGTFGKHVTLKHRYENGRYAFKGGIVINQPGSYTTRFHSEIEFKTLSTYGEHITDCRPEYVKLYFNANNHNENGFHLHQASPVTVISSLTQENYNYGGQFSFVVLP